MTVNPWLYPMPRGHKAPPPPTMWAVLAVIASQTGQRRSPPTTSAAVQEWTGLHRTTVRRALDAWAADGVVSVRHQRGRASLILWRGVAPVDSAGAPVATPGASVDTYLSTGATTSPPPKGPPLRGPIGGAEATGGVDRRDNPAEIFPDRGMLEPEQDPDAVPMSELIKGGMPRWRSDERRAARNGRAEEDNR